MPTVIKSASFDAADALALARFWAAVLGSDVDEDSTADKAFVEAPGGGGRTCGSPGFLSPRRPRTGCTSTCRAPGAVEDEVTRLERAGAAVVRRHPGHVVMTDPEGNEFCVGPGPVSHPRPMAPG